MVLRLETNGLFLGQRRQDGSKVRDEGMVLRSGTTGWFLGQKRRDGS
jgi:hypothetical protein